MPGKVSSGSSGTFATLDCAKVIALCKEGNKRGKVVDAMLRMPLQRTTIALNPDKHGGPRQLDWTRPENRASALVQLTGDLAETPCRRCAGGNGPFADCIVSSVCGAGACGNCVYGSCATRCSFRGAEKTGDSPREEEAAETGEMAAPANDADGATEANGTPVPMPAGLRAALTAAGIALDDNAAIAQWLRDMASYVERAAAGETDAAPREAPGTDADPPGEEA